MAAVDFPLYLVTDRERTGGRPLVPLLRTALNAGLRAIQLRERDLDARALVTVAEELSACVRDAGARLLINDRVDVALALQSDGIHLRSDSLPVAVTRRLVGEDRLIGVSTHHVEDVIRAEGEGADFVVLGPVYDTPSKRGYGAPLGLGPLERAAARCRIPIFAIGGITTTRVREVRRAGAFGVAVVAAILEADDVAGATRDLIRETTAAM